MKRSIFIVLIAIIAASCTKEDCYEGILSFCVTQNDNTQVSAQTKALSETELGNFTTNITDISGGQTAVNNTLYSNIKGQKILLREGNYIAKAHNCTAEEAETSNNNYGSIRYYGEKDFTIKAGELTHVEVQCYVNNSKISVLLKENFLSVFDKSATTVTVSKDTAGKERALQFSNFTILSDSDNFAVAMTDASATESRYAFYPCNCNLYITISTVKTEETEPQTIVYKITEPITTTAATWHKIQIDADLSNAPPTGINVKINTDSEIINNGFSIDGYHNGSLTEDE